MLDDDLSGACGVWVPRVGRGECSALDVSPFSLDVVAATTGGQLALLSLAQPGAQLALLHDSGGDASFAGARWASRSEVVTVGSAAGLSLWDVRAARAPAHAGAPALRCAAGAGGAPACRQRCVAVLAAAPQYVAAGSAEADAGVTLWDLRQPGAPVACTAPAAGQAAPPADGPVWAVAFDTFTPRRDAAAAAAGARRVLAATQGGRLLAAAPPGGATRGETLYDGSAAAAGVTHFAAEPSAGAELVALTQAECLLHWDRARAEEAEEDALMS